MDVSLEKSGGGVDVLLMQDRLEKSAELAQHNLAKSQKDQILAMVVRPGIGPS